MGTSYKENLNSQMPDNVQGITGGSLLKVLEELKKEQIKSLNISSALTSSVGHLRILGETFEVQLTIQSDQTEMIESLDLNQLSE